MSPLWVYIVNVYIIPLLFCIIYNEFLSLLNKFIFHRTYFLMGLLCFTWNIFRIFNVLLYSFFKRTTMFHVKHFLILFLANLTIYFNKPIPYTEDSRLCPVAAIYFSENIRHVIFYSAFRNMKFFGDFFIQHPGCYKFKDFRFSVRKCLDFFAESGKI